MDGDDRSRAGSRAADTLLNTDARFAGRSIRILTIAAASIAVLLAGQAYAQRLVTDPSPHQVGMVAVEGIRIPYLDWGGVGTALVFIPGFGNTAHVFDDFVRRFTGSFRAVGVTRVGFGEADRPETAGYDLPSRVAHIRAALDALRIENAVLVGHSIGGDEITAFAVGYPERTAGLIYLDAAIDHRAALRWEDTARGEIASIEPRASASDLQDVLAYQQFYRRMVGVELPVGEMLAISDFDSAGKVIGQRAPQWVFSRIGDATTTPEFAKVRAPVLALYSNDTPTDLFPWLVDHPEMNARLTALLAEKIQPAVDAERAKFARAIPGAHVETYAAHHYQFLSVPDDTERRMRAFLASISR